MQGRLGNGPIQNITLPSSPTVDVFFIDIINFCGVAGMFDGCADNIPGQSFAVRSDVAQGANGAELEAHELGHDLGLVHCPTNCAGNPNLMSAAGYGSTAITGAQAAIILASGLVQNTGNGDFINLQPIVFAPQPGTMALLCVGGVLFVLGRRRE